MKHFILKEDFRFRSIPAITVITIPSVSPFHGGELTEYIEQKEQTFEWGQETVDFIDRFHETETKFRANYYREPENIILNVKDYMQYVLFCIHRQGLNRYPDPHYKFEMPTHYGKVPIVVVKEGDIQFVPHWSTLL